MGWQTRRVGGMPGALLLVAVLCAGCHQDDEAGNQPEVHRPGPATLLGDIHPGSEGSRPDDLTVFNERVYFSADDGVHGRELWVTDGTPAGTNLVVDITPGMPSSNPWLLTVHQGRLYFRANDGIHGEELWVSDGTAEGTRLFFDTVLGADGGDPTELASAGGLLYFALNRSATNPWRSDGTTEGTFPLLSLGSGESHASTANFAFAPSLNTVFFTRAVKLDSADPECCSRQELWRTNGTRGGTTRVMAFPRQRGTYIIDWIGYLTELPPRLLLFETEDLWATDGTTDGTQLLKTGFMFFGGSHASYGRGIGPPTVFGGKLLFAAVPAGQFRRELWSSDGTSEGTERVSALDLGGWGSESMLVPMGGRLYLLAVDAQQQGGLFRLSAAEPSTSLERVATLETGIGSSLFWPGEMVTTGNGLLFGIDDERELWWSDGTSDGTLRLGSFYPQGPFQLTVLGRRVLFRASTDLDDIELWSVSLD
jgi:ELWxxDGT repeat protein